jgi:hypothetical protein
VTVSLFSGPVVGSQAAVLADSAVTLPPCLCQYHDLGEAVNDPAVEQFVAKR